MKAMNYVRIYLMLVIALAAFAFNRCTNALKSKQGSFEQQRAALIREIDHTRRDIALQVGELENGNTALSSQARARLVEARDELRSHYEQLQNSMDRVASASEQDWEGVRKDAGDTLEIVDTKFREVKERLRAAL